MVYPHEMHVNGNRLAREKALIRGKYINSNELSYIAYIALDQTKSIRTRPVHEEGLGGVLKKRFW